MSSLDKAKIVIIIVSSILAAFLILSVLLVSEPRGTLQGYAVFLDRSEMPQDYFITVNQTDIDSYPLLGSIIDAYDNPDDYPSAYRYEDTLIYEIDRMDLEPRLERLDDYLIERYRAETGSYGVVYFSHTDSGSEVTYYYEWSVAVA